MPPTTDRTALETARQQLEATRAELIAAIQEGDEARIDLEETRRTQAPGSSPLTAAQNRFDAAQAELTRLRGLEREHKQAVQAAIASWLTEASPTGDLARLSADSPIILFPVRLETRFDPPGPPGNATVLKVRIFPDEIFLDVHETALTEEEELAGREYHEGLVPGSSDFDAAELERWKVLVGQFGTTRAAYIARVMRPSTVGGQVVFPTPIRRPDQWTRPGEAVLPDRWVVVAYKQGKPPRTILGSPITEPLQILDDPGLKDDDELVDLGNGFTVDQGVAWTVDFTTAVATGMAVEIPLLDADERTGGFDRLVVVGVKSSFDEFQTTQHLAELFDGHHFTRGLAMVPQGTPTNNTTGKPTPFPPSDRFAEDSFRVERRDPPACRPGPPAFVPGHYQFLEAGLGLLGSFSNTAEAGRCDQLWGQRMNQVLWPVTLGYFMQHVMDPVFTTADVDAGRSYFTSYVRGRGIFPAFRVGSVPYGVLPALSLQRWGQREEHDPNERLEAAMIGPLKHLRALWLQAASLPRVRRTPVNPYDPLLQLLAQDASSKTAQVRNGRGLLAEANAHSFLGIDFAPTLARLTSAARQLATRIGRAGWDPRAFKLTFSAAADDLDVPFVADALSDTAPLAVDYLSGLADASFEQLRDDTVLPPGKRPLLYLLLRQALLLEYVRLGRTRFSTHPFLPFMQLVEIELWFMKATLPHKTPFEFLESPANDEGGGRVFDRIKDDDEMVEFRAAIRELARAPTADLQRLVSETLDTCSHRLDAWVTAFATRRLAYLRTIQRGEEGPQWTSYLGGYGWLEDVRPVARTLETIPGIGQVEIQDNNGGFIHAPSQQHATAAAVLRAGHMAQRREAASKYAIDLSSERARRARRLVREVREGLSLGAALGHQFERGVAQRGVSGTPLIVHRLRNRYPLVANKGQDDPYTEIDRVAARNVVDGALLLTDYNDGKLLFATDPDLPRPGTPAHGALVAELDRLNETRDAVADLVTAEAVYQVVQADIPSAQANVDFLPHGRTPPEPEIVRTDAEGIGVTHRVALLFVGEASPTAPAGWPAAGSTLRSAAEPFLDGWAGQVLGDPTKIVAEVSFENEAGVAQTPRRVRLSELGLRPLDVVALALAAASNPNQGSLIDRRVFARAFADGWQKPRVNYLVDAAAAPGSFPEVLEVARTLGALFAGARPLATSDLHTPFEAQAPVEPPAGQATALLGRARAALAAVATLADDIEAGNVSASAGFARAAELLPDVFPLPGATAAELAPQAAGVVAELRRRHALAPALPTDGQVPGSVTPSVAIRAATEALRALFGPDFLPLAGIGPPPNAPEVSLSLAARSTLLRSDPPALDRFVQQVARVREGMGRWRRVALYLGALGRLRPRADIIQLPHVPDETWAGDTVPAAQGRLSVTLLSPGAADSPSTSQPWRGLLLDDWVEVVPRADRDTGVAFHYDHPTAEAPQVALLAVPSASVGGWSWDELLATVNETLELSHIRTIESRHVPLGQVLPAIYLPTNPQGYTVSTPFLNAVRRAVGSAASGGT